MERARARDSIGLGEEGNVSTVEAAQVDHAGMETVEGTRQIRGDLLPGGTIKAGAEAV